MRLFVFLLSPLCWVYSSFCQIEGGLNVGPTFSRIIGDGVADSVKISGKISLQLNFFGEVELKNDYYFISSIGYYGKGYNASDPRHEVDYAMNYIRLSLGVSKKFPLDDKPTDFNFIAGAAPYAAFGIHTKRKETNNTGPSSVYYENSSDFVDDGLKVVEPGLSFMAGFEAVRLRILANYDLGFSKVFYSDDFGFVKTRSVGISVFYSFEKNK